MEDQFTIWKRRHKTHRSLRMWLFPPNVARLEAQRDVDRLGELLTYYKGLRDALMYAPYEDNTPWLATMRQIIGALGRLRDPRGVQPLRSCRCTYWVLRDEVSRALGQIGDSESIRFLLLEMHEAYNPNKFPALTAHEQALIGIGAAAVPAIQGHLSCCQLAASRLLAKIRGEIIDEPRAAAISSPAVDRDGVSTLSDPVFGKLRCTEQGQWEGRVMLRGRDIPVTLWAAKDGPGDVDRSWFRQIEQSYEQLIGKLASAYKEAPSMSVSEIRMNGPNRYSKYEWSLWLDGGACCLYASFIALHPDAIAMHPRSRAEQLGMRR